MSTANTPDRRMLINEIGLKMSIDEVLALDPPVHETIVTSLTGGMKGVKDERYDLIPPGSLRWVARVYGYGTKKYSDTNWAKGYSWRYSYGALLRHVEAARGGEWFDPESRLPHLAHAAWHCFTLMFYQTHSRYNVYNDLDWRNAAFPEDQAPTDNADGAVQQAGPGGGGDAVAPESSS